MGWGGGKGAAGGAGGGNRWSRGGGKGGKGGGRTPWSFFHVCDTADSLGILALANKIPDEWIDWRHGGRRQPERMHSTVLLKMSGPQHLPRLKTLCQETAPVSVTVRELFCSHVERITDAEVYCIGVGLASPELRALKDAWTSEEAEQQRKVHVPYDSEGHISIAYVHARFRQQAEEFARQNFALFADRTFILDHISYEDEWGVESRIALEGGAGVKRPVDSGGGKGHAASKGPRTAPDSRPGALPAGTVMEVDGSVLEGGGQILRMSSAYSALFGVPIHITKIRAGRSKPGLAAQHLESLRLVRDVSSGQLTNDFVGSCEVTLTPRLLASGNFEADPGTAGAITLMVQASLFPLLLSGGASRCSLRGGTDVAYSPPLDFLRRVLLPTLERMGVGATVECPTRGFFPRGGGQVHLSVPSLGAPLRPLEMSERGEPTRVEAILYSTSPLGALEGAATAAVQGAVAHLAPRAVVKACQVRAPDDRTHKFWVDLVVETDAGALFHGSVDPKDMNAAGKGKGKGKGSKEDLPGACAMAATEASRHLEEQLGSGAAVEVHLADQLILPASLAAGKSRLLVGELSMHAKTAIHIAELLVPGAKFSQQQRGKLSMLEIEGVGYSPGGGATGAPEQRPGAGPADCEDVVRLVPGALSRAPPSMLRDFENDMRQLSDCKGARVAVDKGGDRLLVQGSPAERRAAREELADVLAFYQIQVAK